jgi:hypothetical protein
VDVSRRPDLELVGDISLREGSVRLLRCVLATESDRISQSRAPVNARLPNPLDRDPQCAGARGLLTYMASPRSRNIFAASVAAKPF